MDWGKGILITIIIFLAGTAVMIIIAMNSEYDLVANNYYEQGIKYQDKIDRINRTNALPEKVKIEFLENEVLISMPRMFAAGIIKGDVIFYRPSDAGSDFKIPLQFDSENKMSISTAKFKKGYWKIQVDWRVETTAYYNESFVTIK